MENNSAGRAIMLHADDTVAVVLQSIRKGSTVHINGPGDPHSLTAGEDIPCYHKLSLVSMQPGKMLIRNGIVIGRALQAIKVGDWVHTHNLVSLRSGHSTVVE